MKFQRGDIALARFPHAGGNRGKKRPVVIIQSDQFNPLVPHVIVAEITGNVAAANDPTCLMIETATPDGKATGLTQDSVIGCLFLATIHESRISDPIGRLSPTLLQQLDGCIKLALGVA